MNLFYNFVQRLTTLKETYFYQMSCTRDDLSAKISLKEHFWWDLIGVWKITLLSKDPVEFLVYQIKNHQTSWYCCVDSSIYLLDLMYIGHRLMVSPCLCRARQVQTKYRIILDSFQIPSLATLGVLTCSLGKELSWEV